MLYLAFTLTLTFAIIKNKEISDPLSIVVISLLWSIWYMYLIN